MITMFAIPNCETVKKARSFLEKKKIAYEFTDFKKSPPTKTQIKEWGEYLGELPVNKKGLTYRKYKDTYEALPNSEKINFIIANPSIIKRPILVKNGKTIAIGFDENQWSQTPIALS
ncbi:MAG: Spx/MgsR family RNA polymerase-binding regulatory protein [Legionella sp.]|nr:MAG: Spx/MgsR family RNA polymerase-binding regulatory protein [Legionella sp.]